MSEILDKAIMNMVEKPYEDTLSILETYERDIDETPKPTGLGDFVRYMTALGKWPARIREVNYNAEVSQIRVNLEKGYEIVINEYQQKEVEINNKYESLLDLKVGTLEEEAREKNQEVIEQFNEENSIYVELEEKRKVLEEYSTEVIELCAQYGVTTSDITISNSSFRVEELSEIYDQYIDFMKKRKGRSNPIKAFRKKVPNPLVQGSLLLGILLLGFTRLLDFIAIAFFIAIIVRQVRAKELMKIYSVLLGLIFNIRPLQMGFKTNIDKEKLVEESVDENTDERLEALAAEWESKLAEYDENHPEKDLNADRLQLVNLSSEIEDGIQTYKIEVESIKQKLIDKVNQILEDTQKEFDEAKSKVVLLGDEVSKSPVLNTCFRLGLRDGCIEEYVDIGLQNVIIRPSRDEVKQRRFLQVMLANAFCNVQAGCMSVTVYDPYNLGQDVVSFYSKDIEDLYTDKNTDLDGILKELTAYAQQNIREQGSMDINTYNKEADEIGKTPKMFRLLLVLSEPKTIEESAALKEFMQYSATKGVLVWVVSASMNLPDVKVFNYPFEGVQNPYTIDEKTLGAKVSSLIAEERKKNKSKALFWRDFIDVICPDDKIWTFSAEKFIDMYAGYENGDPSKHPYFSLGHEGNVHAIAAGTTGSGKSVFLNALIATLCRMYSPETLELWLGDFKGVEFGYYLPSEKYPFTFPHIKTCLCTSDGDYAGSVFKALDDVCKQREKLAKAAQVKNLPAWNALMRNQGTPELCWQRIIFICDEFQNIFQRADRKIIDEIILPAITHLGKIGRAFGTHMLFTSQSMVGTLSKDVLDQFSLRFALRCEEEVSMALLNSKNASSIKEKNGYLYIKSYEMKTPEEQRRMKIPYAEDEIKGANPDNRLPVLREHMKEMWDLAAKRGIPRKDIISYEESTIHPLSEVDDFYDKAPITVDSGVFVLGMRMVYSENRAPWNCILGPKNNTHIFSAFSDNTDLVNFYKTIICNIRHSKKEAMVFVNSQSADLHHICSVDEDITGPFLEMSTEKTSIKDLCKMFQSAYEKRVASENKDPAYFILIGWDKAIGFGVDKDFMLVQQFAILLQTCGEYNMHFIFINSSIAAIGQNITGACEIKIAGRVDETTSVTILGKNTASKVYEGMDNGYMFVNRKGEISRLKIYRSTITREIVKDEIVM